MPTGMQHEEPTIEQPTLKLALMLHVTIEQPIPVGETPQGHAVHIPITGGTFSGATMSGTVLPGADRLVVRPDGVRFVSALYEIQTSDGTLITVRNEGPASDGQPVRTTPRFTAPRGKHEWLNKSIFVGTVEASVAKGFVSVRIDQVV